MKTRALMTVLCIALVAPLFVACDDDGGDLTCHDYRKYVKAGSAQDQRDIREGNNPCI